MTDDPEIVIPLSRPYVADAEKQAVLEVLESGNLVQGTRVARLEKLFAEMVGAPHALATSSGTTALHVALLAHGIGPGDEVVTTPFTFIASVNSILYAGARPVFADVQEDTFNIDPDSVERAISARTRAIMPVHLYGQPCDMEALASIARRHGLILIEDCAQAIGATYAGRAVGSFGTGCFSLYATKNVMSAEGGMVVTHDDEVAERVRMLRAHGMKRRYMHEMLGFNFRMSDVHAAIGVVQMGRMEGFIRKRRANADFLNKHITSVVTPRVQHGAGHVWHQYTVRATGRVDRGSAVERLQAAGVGTGIFYPVPAHRHPYMAEAAGAYRLPVAEQLAEEVLSLPIHPWLSDDELRVIATEVNRL